MKQILKLAIIAVGCLMAGLFLLALILFFIVYKNDSKQLVEDRYLTNRQYAKVINAPYIPCEYADFLKKNKKASYQIDYGTNKYDCPYLTLTGDGIVYYFYPDVYSYDKLGEEAVRKDTDKYILSKIVITNDSYRFGKKKIGVGSTRAEVEEAYRDNMKCYEVEGLGKGYIDGYWLYVRFLYDKDGKVSQISLFQEL